MDETAYHALSSDEALAALRSSAQGLSSREAERRLSVHGPNDLVSAKPRSRLAILLSQLKDLLVVVLIVAGCISFGIAFVEGSCVITSYSIHYTKLYEVVGEHLEESRAAAGQDVRFQPGGEDAGRNNFV